jgi:hypothetical protein
VLCVCEQVLSDMPIPVLHLTQPLGRTVCPMQIQADMPGPRVAASTNKQMVDQVTK